MTTSLTKTQKKPVNGTGAQLYRHFNSENELIYVGVSLSAVGRLMQHKRHARWFADIANVTIQHFECREKALEAERTAIKEEEPKCNVKHRKSEFEKKEESRQAELERQRLVNRIVRLETVYTCDQAGVVLGRSGQFVKAEIQAGKLRCIEFKHGKNTRRIVSGWHLIDYLEEQGYM